MARWRSSKSLPLEMQTVSFLARKGQLNGELNNGRVDVMDINAMMNSFRIAGRELFNNYFRLDAPWDRANEAWTIEERFRTIEKVLFQKLVTEPAGLVGVSYGALQPGITVELRSDFAPAMVNRQIDSGYWDHPITEITREARLLFIRLFDWDQLDYRDNQYVRVKIDEWHAHPEVAGKHALLECRHIKFGKI